VNRVAAGFFSLSHASPTGDDRPYLEWHRLDHMPEQYGLPGIVLGQRWISTAPCRAARAAAEGEWSLVEHVVCYLMGRPLDETVDEFYRLGRHLAEVGRFPHSLPSQYAAPLALLEAHAAPRVLVSPEVVPFRPHRGVYLVVEEPAADEPQDAFLQRMHVEVLPALVAVPGVAGAWSFATTPALRRPFYSPGRFRMTLCYLDDEPAEVASRLGALVPQWWGGAPSRLLLAAPFESPVRGEWEPR
jgi:hypothetical protein